MKITIALLLFAFSQCFSNVGFCQKQVSLNLKNVKLEKALDEIERQSDLYFVFNQKLVDVTRIVNLSAKHKDIKEVLDDLFAGVDVNYRVLDKQILLAPGKFIYPVSTEATQKQIKISGVVVDVKGITIPGVTVKVKGTSNGVTTDSKGRFNLSVPNEKAILTVSCIGYVAQDILVGAQQQISIILQDDIKKLDEVVVVGYGTQKKVNLTGSVSSVSSTEITKRTSTNVANLLQGKVAGLQVTQSSGEPGNDNPVLRIRGIGTFSSAGSDPLVLVDGISGSLSNLNSNDIETISVLKDAASASIYGARAANGVILVTTKQGKSDGLNIEYSTNYQIQQPTSMPKFVTNSATFMTDWNYANQRAGLPNYFDQATIDAFKTGTDPIKYPNFNWIDHMISNGAEQNHNLSMSGGNEKTKFNVSMGYLDQTGINSAFKYSRANMRFNINSKLNKIISFGSNIALTYSDRVEPVMGSSEFMLLTYTAGPNYLPKLSDGSGRWTWRYNSPAWHNRNPEQALSYGDKKHYIYSLTAQTYVDVNLLKDLVFEVKGAVNYDVNFDKSHEHPVASYFYSDNTLAATVTGYNPGVQDNFAQNILATLYSTLNYTKSIGNHDINVLLGYSQEANHYNYLQGYKQIFPTDGIGELNAGSTAVQSVAGSSNDWGLQSVFGRLNYNYKGKYLIESNFRYDGTSRIASDHRWGLFPSISAGWRLSEEKFMKQVSWLDNLKLRASWGKLGNQNIGLYPYQDILSVNSYAFSSVSQGAAVTRLTDKALKWETTTVKDLGVDFSIKNGLISATADYFDKVTDDILYNISVPASIGLSSPTVNYGKMQNKGFEFVIGHANTIGDFKYSINFNISSFSNKVLRVNAPTLGSQTIIQNGLPWNAYYLTQAIGIFQNQAEIDASPKQQYNPKPGDLKFKDQNADGVIDAKDRVVVGGAYPDFYYGSSMNLSWKNFDLSAFFQGVKGQKFIIDGWGITPFIQGCAPTVDFAKNCWTPTNPTNNIHYPAMYTNGYGPVTGTRSTYFLQDGSYFRLKNLMIGYNVPNQFCKKIWMKGLRIYLSGDNLLTITKYPGADPERTGSGNFQTYPQMKTYTIGLNVKF
ncbi:MAG: TonB-dependent receptor [Bacteroidetes bacterium]|nr:TonB-dependent receptor [Bacteroidota bacterium]